MTNDSQSENLGFGKKKFLNLVVFCLFETVFADMWNPSLAEFEKRSHKLTPGQFFALPKGIKKT